MPKIVDVPEQRRGISSTAARLIAKQGLENLSIRNVAAAHGCSKGMVQHYFPNKEELLFGALLFVNESDQQRVDTATRGAVGLAKIEKRFAVVLPTSDDIRDEWIVRFAFYARAAVEPRMQAYLNDHVMQAAREGVQDLKEAARRNEIPQTINFQRSYRNLISMVAGVAVAEVVSPNSLSPSAQKLMLKDAINGFLSPIR